ncbi:hypothetical protein MMC21_003814 [Puttea exsequens]|nr:hypothetical protein [Puttea exsequens]
MHFLKHSKKNAASTLSSYLEEWQAQHKERAEDLKKQHDELAATLNAKILQQIDEMVRQGLIKQLRTQVPELRDEEVAMILQIAPTHHALMQSLTPLSRT